MITSSSRQRASRSQGRRPLGALQVRRPAYPPRPRCWPLPTPPRPLPEIPALRRATAPAPRHGLVGRSRQRPARSPASPFAATSCFVRLFQRRCTAYIGFRDQPCLGRGSLWASWHFDASGLTANRPLLARVDIRVRLPVHSVFPRRARRVIARRFAGARATSGQRPSWASMQQARAGTTPHAPSPYPHRTLAVPSPYPRLTLTYAHPHYRLSPLRARRSRTSQSRKLQVVKSPTRLRSLAT